MWLAPMASGGAEMILEPVKGEIQAVCDGGFEKAAAAFDRVEFGAVGRQREWAEDL